MGGAGPNAGRPKQCAGHAHGMSLGRDISHSPLPFSLALCQDSSPWLRLAGGFIQSKTHESKVASQPWQKAAGLLGTSSHRQCIAPPPWPQSGYHCCCAWARENDTMPFHSTSPPSQGVLEGWATGHPESAPVEVCVDRGVASWHAEAPVGGGASLLGKALCPKPWCEWTGTYPSVWKVGDPTIRVDWWAQPIHSSKSQNIQ